MFARIPVWAWPIAIFGVHYVMIFRGVLFAELTTGGGSARLCAFQASMRR